VGKRDWLNMALQILATGGVDAVRIRDLAQQLKISKSGFYWHFRDRSDLLESLKGYWIDEFSTQFMKNAKRQEGPLRERLISLVQAIRAKKSGKLDLAFVSWAQSDPSVRALVDRVRDMRIAFAKELLAETGVSDPELTTRANLFVIYFMWSDVVLKQGESELVGEDLNGVLDIITGELSK
jgi:AcrR family transcriptional regulator